MVAGAFVAPAAGACTGAAGGLVFEDEPHAAKPVATARLSPAAMVNLRMVQRGYLTFLPFLARPDSGHVWQYIRKSGRKGSLLRTGLDPRGYAVATRRCLAR